MAENTEQEKQELGSSLPESVPVCPNCLTPCDPYTYYCPNCSSNEIINPRAGYMPFRDIRFTTGMYGKLWKKINEDRKFSKIQKIVYCFFFLIFILGPLLPLTFPLFAIDKIKNAQRRKMFYRLYIFLLIVAFIIFIYWGIITI